MHDGVIKLRSFGCAWFGLFCGVFGKKKNLRVFSDIYDFVYNLWDKILYWVAIWVES